MENISLNQLEEMQKDLFQKQCDLDIQKAFVKHFIKKKKAEQSSFFVVSHRRELLIAFFQDKIKNLDMNLNMNAHELVDQMLKRNL